MLLLPEGQTAEAWELSKKKGVLFQKSENIGQQSTFTFSLEQVKV
jgi:hypothetical protein